MSKATSTLGRPIQGVSQQPDRSRREGQCSKQENMTPSVVEGLRTRTGTTHVSELVDLPAVVLFGTHHYVRGNEEYFMVLPANSLPKVYDKNGVPQVVVDSCLDNTYVKSVTPNLNLKCNTVGDYTFINNVEVGVELRSDLSPELPTDSLVYVQFATYGKYYQVVINGILAGHYQTPDGELPEQSYDIDTSHVATQLIEGGTAYFESNYTLELYGSGESQVAAKLPLGAVYDGDIGAPEEPDFVVTSGGFTYFVYNRAGTPPDYTLPFPDDIYTIKFSLTSSGLGSFPNFDVVQYGNIIHIVSTTNAEYTISTIDGADGADLIAIKGEIKDLGKLPPTAPAGFKIKIQNSGQANDNGYWLEATSQSTGSTVKWVESIAPEVKLGYDKTTMPYVLVRENIVAGVATFTLREGEWEDRDVGDDFSNPFLAFIDEDNPQPITNLGIFQNRLYLTSGETVSMSKSGEFFNFNRTSTQTSSEDDPISGYADSNQVNVFTATAVLDGDLIYFSKLGQFKTSGKVPINKENFTISQTTSFAMNTDASPVVGGESIFFSFNQGNFTGVREYFTDSDTDTKRARPVTEHVDKYLERSAKIMATSPNINMLLVYTGTPAGSVYVYDWMWVGNEKVQSAWHIWKFKDVNTIYGMYFSNDRLYFIFNRYGRLWLEYIELNKVDSEEFGFEVALDRKVRILTNQTMGVYRGTNPFPLSFPTINQYYVAVRGEGAYSSTIGASIDFEASTSYITTEEDLAGGGYTYITMGIPIDVKYIPSKPQILDFKERPVSIDSLMLSRMYVNCDLSGKANATVTTDFGQVRESSYTSRVLGLMDNIVGYTKPRKAQHVIPISFYADKVSVEITTNDHAPLVIRDIEWAGQYKQRGRRV